MLAMACYGAGMSRPTRLPTLGAATLAVLALAGCAGARGYPSLARLPAERIGIAVPPAPAPAPPAPAMAEPLPAETVARAERLAAAVASAHARFTLLAGRLAAAPRRDTALAELEVARAAVLKAQQLLDAGEAEASRADAAASVAKGMVGLASVLSVQEGVQMHGGMGMTDAYDIGLFMKRQRVLAELFGDSDYHAERLARLSGY